MIDDLKRKSCAAYAKIFPSIMASLVSLFQIALDPVNLQPRRGNFMKKFILHSTLPLILLASSCSSGEIILPSYNIYTDESGGNFLTLREAYDQKEINSDVALNVAYQYSVENGKNGKVYGKDRQELEVDGSKIQALTPISEEKKQQAVEDYRAFLVNELGDKDPVISLSYYGGSFDGKYVVSFMVTHPKTSYILVAKDILVGDYLFVFGVVIQTEFFLWPFNVA